MPGSGSFPGLVAALTTLPKGRSAAPFFRGTKKGTFPMRTLSKRELRATRTLAQMLMESGVSFEAAAEIIGMRLKYLGAFSIPNVARVFRVDP